MLEDVCSLRNTTKTYSRKCAEALKQLDPRIAAEIMFTRVCFLLQFPDLLKLENELGMVKEAAKVK